MKYYHRLIVSGLFLLNAATGLAQNESRIRQLEKDIAAATSDTLRIKSTLQLAFELSDVDTVKALTLTQIAEAESKVKKYPTGLLRAQWSYARIYDIQGKNDSSRWCYGKTLVLARKYALVADETSSLINLGLSYVRENKLELAMDFYNQAEENAVKYNQQVNLADVYRKKANILLQLLDYNKAVDFLKSAETIYAQRGDSTGLGEVTGSIGFAYRNWGKNDTAILYFKKAIVLFNALGYQTMVPIAYTEIGKAYDEKNEADSALANYFRAEELYKTIPYPPHQDALHAYIGTLLVKKGRAGEAVPHLEKALRLARETGDLEVQSDALFGLKNYYNAKGDYKISLQYYELYDSINAVLTQNEQLAKVTEMTEKYEGAKKEQALQRQKFLAQRRKYWVIGIAAFSGLAALLGYSWYRRYRLRQETRLQQAIMKQQDEAARAVLEAEENERKRIAADLHDGVGQLMSAAKMNLSAWQSHARFADEKEALAFEKIISLVDESAKEVRSVSHNLMPNPLLKASLAGAVREFIEQIDNRVLKVNLHTEGLNEKLEASIETVLYRVIQECVNNVIKHSGASLLDISLVREAHEVAVTIEDNGRGFDMAVATTADGVGLKSIRSRVAYLKGEVEFNSAPGKGTLVAIHIPLQDA
jgi:two-component system, NarL family, sensor kinase